MEKYSRFRDEGTGIAPFLRAGSNSREFGLAHRLVLWTVSALTVAVVILSISAYGLALRHVLPGFARRFYVAAFVFVPLRVFYRRFTYKGEQQASVRKKAIRKAAAGDVILANFVSPLDVLMYESALPAAEFVFPAKEGTFESVSLLQAMRRALTLPRPPKAGASLDSLVARAQKAGRTVVLFVEGTTSNGRGLLTLKGLNTHAIAATSTQVYAAAVRYTPPSAASPEPESLLDCLWRVSSATWWYMAAIKVSGEPLAKAHLSPDYIARAIAGLGRLRILGDRLDARAKEEYVVQKRTRH